MVFIYWYGKKKSYKAIPRFLSFFFLLLFSFFPLPPDHLDMGSGMPARILTFSSFGLFPFCFAFYSVSFVKCGITDPLVHS